MYYRRTYLGEDLDVVADLKEVHLVVKLKDMHARACAPGIEDHGVLAHPRKLHGPLRRGTAFAAKHRDGKGRGRRSKEEEQEKQRGGDDASHWRERGS